MFKAFYEPFKTYTYIAKLTMLFM